MRRLWTRWVAHRRAMTARLIARHSLVTRRPTPTRLLVALTGERLGLADDVLATWPGGRVFVPPLREVETDAVIEDATLDQARELTAANQGTALAASSGAPDVGRPATAEPRRSEAVLQSGPVPAPADRTAAPITALPRGARPEADRIARTENDRRFAESPSKRQLHPAADALRQASAPSPPPRRVDEVPPPPHQLDIAVAPATQPSTPRERAGETVVAESLNAPSRDEAGADRAVPMPTPAAAEPSGQLARELVKEVVTREPRSIAAVTSQAPVDSPRQAEMPSPEGVDLEVAVSDVQLPISPGKHAGDDAPVDVFSPIDVEPPSEPVFIADASHPRTAEDDGDESSLEAAVSDERGDAKRTLGTTTDVMPTHRPPVSEERRARRPAPSRDAAGARRPAHQVQRPDAPTLFEPRHPNRSAAEWMKLLVEATITPKSDADAGRKPPRTPAATGARHRASAPSRDRSVPLSREPLLQSTRRFLRPLVAVDPDTVAIYRGPGATAMADALRADALTIGDTVVLPPTHDERTPEGRALIAHELTHVAQRRAEGSGRRVRTPTDERRVPILDADERAARTVEAVVRSAAENDPDRAGERAAPWFDDPMPEAGGTVAEPTIATQGNGGDIRPRPRSGRQPWGTLPAPWEPMPDLEPSVPAAPSWSTGPSVEARPTASIGAAPPPAGGAPASAPVADAAPAAEVRLAEADRPTASAEPAMHHAANADSAHPDVEQLARQVYDILKRQLAAERRRGA